MTANTSARWIVRIEIIGFSAILLMTWMNEIVGISQFLFKGTHELNWQDALTESIIELAVAIPTILISWRIARRLHYLERFLRVCSWCRKVGHDDEWISFEEFVERKLNTQTSHGICPHCLEKMSARVRSSGPEEL